jgi:hypothetical protein
MYAEAERDMVTGIAVQVQPVRVGERLRVAVADVVGEDQSLAGLDHLAVELDVLQHRPAPAVVGDVQDLGGSAVWLG